MGKIKITDRKSTLSKVLMLIRKYSFLLLISFIFAAASVLLSLYIPILAGDAIDLIVAKGKVNFTAIVPILIRIGIIAAVTAILQWIVSTVNNKITYKVVYDIRNKAFEKIQSLPLKYIDTHSHGDIVSRIIADADQFSEGLLLGFTQLFTGVVTILATIVFMIFINPLMTIVVVVLTPISLFTAKFIATKTYKLFKEQSEARGNQTSFINEMVSNIKVVKAFSREKETLNGFDKTNLRLEKASLNAVFYSSITNPVTRFINGIVYAAVALTGAIAAVSGHITIGGLTCFLSYANQYTKPFNEISGVITELQNAFVCAARIFELIEERPQVPDSKNALTNYNAAGGMDFRNVSFSYTSETTLIKNLNLNVKPGQRVAIVGPTGCGKTTLINLIMRFYDPDRGGIYIDGIHTKDITRQELRSNFGMVLQETWLKKATVRDNIRMAKPDADDDEIIAAAKATHAHSFIKRLKNGYDTVIGEDGGNLSGGQKQLLCITRIMLSLPPMLILDEATSSIDTRTELKISDAFSRMMQGRTSFIVAHRLSTIKDADIILVMEDGNIIEQGRHYELLEKNGFYTRLYKSQFEF